MGKKTTAKEDMDRLRAALLERGGSASASLSERLDRCAVDWNGRFECRSPACWHCRRRHINRERRVVQNWFGHLANEDLGFATVVMGATSDIDGVGDLIARNRDNTRKRVAASRRQSATWNGVYLAGWHEIDAVGSHHLSLLPPKRRALLEQIAPLSFGSNSPAWIGTWHGIVHLNGLPAENIAYEFARQWKLDGQVHVRAFDLNLPVSANLDRVTSYANKFEPTIKLKDGFVEPWPMDWKAEFFGYLQAAQRNPFEALRFTVSPRIVQAQAPVVPVIQPKRRDAMPCLFSGVPMYESTGGLR